MLYPLARIIWNVVKWIWLALIVAFLIGLAANLGVVPVTELPKTLIVYIITWMLLPGFHQVFALGTLILLLAITFVSGALVVREQYTQGEKALQRYLHSILAQYEDLTPMNISSQQAQLLSINVPLEAIFIHLRALSDRPLYDVARGQQQLYTELKERNHHAARNPEGWEQHIQRLWYSQLGQKVVEGRQKQDVVIEEVIQRLTAKSPGAVILGEPGAGKSTTMRWLALHMVRASLQPGYQHWFNRILRLFMFVPTARSLSSSIYCLPEGLSPSQIPLLLRIRDYANYPSTGYTQDTSVEAFRWSPT